VSRLLTGIIGPSTFMYNPLDANTAFPSSLNKDQEYLGVWSNWLASFNASSAAQRSKQENDLNSKKAKCVEAAKAASGSQYPERSVETLGMRIIPPRSVWSGYPPICRAE
jgi:hypothetical protein